MVSSRRWRCGWRRGRDLHGGLDVRGCCCVVIVNELRVELHMKGGDPIGLGSFARAARSRGNQSVPDASEIVGVVRDVKNQGTTSPIEPGTLVLVLLVPSRSSQGLLVEDAGAPPARWSAA